MEVIKKLIAAETEQSAKLRIAVASGKGGTGKTLVATNLAHLWAKQGQTVLYIDADAEEPNGHLFLKPDVSNQTRFFVPVPELDQVPCAGHKKCQEICAFNAILAAKGSIVVFDELCHGCGACILACPSSALVERQREIGTISHGNIAVGARGRIEFLSSRLNVGEARVAPLIEGVVHLAHKRTQLTIIDAPPGTSCSAIAAVREADLLLLVTEPTPFGLHDLKLAVEMGRALNLRIAAVINRAQLGDASVKEYLTGEAIPILAEIPFDRAVAKAYAAGKMAVYESESLYQTLTTIKRKLTETMERDL